MLSLQAFLHTAQGQPQRHPKLEHKVPLSDVLVSKLQETRKDLDKFLGKCENTDSQGFDPFQGVVSARCCVQLDLSLRDQCQIRDRSTILARHLSVDRGDAAADEQVQCSIPWPSQSGLRSFE